eukprot:scaffold14625_cov125-Isochrysis_galbana.AAC.9
MRECMRHTCPVQVPRARAHWAHLCACRSQHSAIEEPMHERPRPYEVYASLPGVDNLFTGLGKRTPSGGFFTS